MSQDYKPHGRGNDQKEDRLQGKEKGLLKFVCLYLRDLAGHGGENSCSHGYPEDGQGKLHQPIAII